MDMGGRIIEHGLAPAHRGGICAAHIEDVAHVRELVANIRGSASITMLQPKCAGTWLTVKRAVGERLLDIHVVVDEVGDELRVGKGLVDSAHDAEADVLVAMLHKSRG